MKRLGNLSAVLLGLILLVTTGPQAAYGQVAPRWKTQAAFQRALASRFEMVEWPQASQLRDQLQRLARWQQVAVFLDRRIDPNQVIQLSARDISLAALLDQVAAQAGGVSAQIGSVVYIGPRETVGSLSAIVRQRAEEARSLGGTAAARLLRQRSMRWEELAEPRKLLAELGEEAGVTIDGITAIPHDLWPAVDLPPLSWTDRVSIVLAGFGMTFDFEQQGRSIRLRPMPAPTLIKRRYDATLSQIDLERVTQRFPDAVIEQTPQGMMVEGTAEEHERLKNLLARQSASPRPRSGEARTVHSLRVQQQPIGAILKTLERKLNLKLEYDAGIREKLYMRVTFDLKDVSLEELLKATLDPASLTFRRDGDVIRIEQH